MASVEEMVVQPIVLARITGRTSPTQLGHVQLPGRQRTRSRRALSQDRRAWPVSPQKKQAPRRAASQRSRRGVRERALERTLQLVGARRREVLPLQGLRDASLRRDALRQRFTSIQEVTQWAEATELHADLPEPAQPRRVRAAELEDAPRTGLSVATPDMLRRLDAMAEAVNQLSASRASLTADHPVYAVGPARPDLTPAPPAPAQPDPPRLSDVLPDRRRCFYCGLPGHFINDCRRKKRDRKDGRYNPVHRSSGGRNDRRVDDRRDDNQRERRDRHDNRRRSHTPPPAAAAAAPAAPVHSVAPYFPPFYHPAYQAPLSVSSGRVIFRAPPAPLSRLRIRSVTGDVAALGGPLDLSVNWNGSLYKWQFYEADIAEECIVGSDMMGYFMVNILYSNRTIQVCRDPQRNMLPPRRTIRATVSVRALLRGDDVLPVYEKLAPEPLGGPRRERDQEPSLGDDDGIPSQGDDDVDMPLSSGGVHWPGASSVEMISLALPSGLAGMWSSSPHEKVPLITSATTAPTAAVPRNTVLAEVSLLHPDEIPSPSSRRPFPTRSAECLGNPYSTDATMAASTDQAPTSAAPEPEPRPPRRVLPPDAPLPPDLQRLVDGCEDISDSQRQEVNAVLREFSDVFAEGDEIGLCTWEQFRIDTDCKACTRLENQDTKRAAAAATSVCRTQLLAAPAWLPDEMRADQLADPTIRPILEACERGQRPPADEAVAYGSEARTLWLQWDSLFVKNGVLHRRWRHPSGDPGRDREQLVLPANRVPEVVREYHALPGTGSHFKVTRTLAKLRDRFYWPGAIGDIRDIIASCESCCRVHGAGRGRTPGPMRVFNDNTFLGRWTIDIAGPYPAPTACPRYAEAARVHKKWYCLVCVESFTNWPEVLVVHNIDAETSARAIVDGLVSRFGAFRDIHSDQGRNWEASVFKEVMALLHIRKTRTTPLYPKGQRALRAEEQRDWPSWIPLILLAYRTAPHSATRVSPAEMLYGRMLSLPADLAREPPPAAHLPFNESEYPRWLRETMRRIHADARVMREATSQKYKVNYDLSTALFPGKPGDAVWLYRPVRKPGRNPKLAPKWEGPYVILERVNDLIVWLQSRTNGKKRMANVQNIAPYVDPDFPVRGSWLTFL
ncbi:Retrovirus-related Pol polyprotein from transposon 412 [Frankliniella fusca]|uniref:RNA-directed DNA polymerase n=2 Tax=Frankliniella fusca TaxID=407009 RepID=A0AAE1HMU9_9NEOP|nr:Retrovirus-related Pol polyprotein from transposon 412 [Frankliniella fusca]